MDPKNITTEEYREYDFDGRVYRIEAPQTLYVITETLSLRAEVQADDALLANYRRTIACIPPCSQHGDDCLPHAEDWIKCRQADEAELVSLRRRNAR